MPPKPQMMLGPQVQLVERLHGTVWLADQLDWKKKVLVEFLRELPTKDDAALTQFLERCEASRQVAHGNLRVLHDFGVDDDFTPYLVVEHLDGTTLRERMTEADRLSPNETGQIVSQLAGALTAIHGEGLTHLALSPDHVVLVKGSTIHVKLTHLAIGGSPLVDPASLYLSPEQYVGRDTDARSDLWALAALAYLMLTGQDPIDPDKRAEMNFSCVPPSEMWLTDVPATVDAFFEQGLHRDPEKRFASAEEVTVAFSTMLKGLPSMFPSEEGQVAKIVEIGAGGDKKAKKRTKSDVVLQDMDDEQPGISIELDD